MTTTISIADAFGSRLANDRPNEQLDESPSTLAEPLEQADNGFANRQGSLLQPEANDQTAPRRQVRQPAPQQLNRQQQQQQPRPQRPSQDQQQLARQQQQQQERFQRLRTPPSGQLLPANFEQFPRPQQAQQQQQQPRAQQQLNANGLPTLSAFDLSSLANLANNQPQAQPQPQIQFVTNAPQIANGQQLAALSFRRQTSPQQQQPNGNRNQAPPAGFFGELARAQAALPSGQQQPKPTELPFIRQVFRPALVPGESGESDELNQSQPRPGSGGRPTPPPLFVPGRQQQPLAGRPPRPLETGFAPIQPANPRPESMFFEPTGQRQRQQAPQLQPPRALANQQTVRLPPLPPAADSIGEAPASANQLDQQQQQQSAQQQRKPPVRRPSQRPHVPLAQVGQQPAAQLPTTTQSSRAPAAPDVIRVAANAIQAAQEGLAAISGAATSPAVLQELPQATTQASASPTAATTSERPQTVTTTASSAPTTTEPNTGRRAVSAQRAPSSPASNFFQTLTSTATMAPSPFSPALPINQAVAASGGRRRIPVRNQSQQQQRAQTTTLPSITTTATTATGSTGSGPVRRPEIEEFYETIGASQGFSLAGSPATTQIDGFGVPARPRPPARVPELAREPPTTTPQGEPERLPTTTTDLYGSRLQANQQAVGLQSAGSQQDQRDTAASSLATGQLQQLERVRPEVAAAASASASASALSEQAALSPPAAPIQPADRQQAPVMVPVTYVTTLSYLTTVLHGTHTLETSHESVERSTKMATLNAQLMDQIEHKLPLIEPTATLVLSSRTKGRGTTMVNLKSAVSAFNQELVDALGAANGAAAGPQVEVSSSGAAASLGAAQSSMQLLTPASRKQQKPLVRGSRTVGLEELASAGKQLLTEYVYLYTMRPVEQPEQTVALSTRTEMVGGPALSEAELANRLQEARQQLAERLIDSNGLLRLQPEVDFGAINLGSTVGKETPQMLTEVNVNLNTFIKFDGLSNVLLEVRPTRLADNSQEAGDTSGPLQPRDQRPSQRPAAPLDTSFNVQLTLGNALDQLERPRHTPALGDQATAPGQQQPSATKTDELLRSSAAESQPPATPASSSSQLSRSQLRSRVSSRIRNSSLQTLQPARAASPASSPTLAVASDATTSAAPSLGNLRQRPNKSRLVRPQLSRQSASAIESAATLDSVAGQPDPTAQAAQPAAASSTLATRSTKPRFVVVTKTGQFGVRASAKSSLAAAAAAAAASTSVWVEPSQTQPSLQTLRVSSRFSKIRSRFGASQSRGLTSPAPSELPPMGPTSTQPPSAPTASTSSPSSAEHPPAEPSATQSTTARPQEEEPPAIKLDGSQSVVVTYFTTTTHTIPFELNSETVFTTIEETNSRIATEFMSDLSSHFIEPSPTATLPTIAQTQAPTLPGSSSSEPHPATSGSSQLPQTTTPTWRDPSSSGTSSSPSQPTTSGAPEANGANGAKEATPPIEPSFVVALNTRTFFTTFTYFTTYSAGTGSQSVKSSESTTSNIITETISSPATLSPPVAPTSAPSLESTQQLSESQPATPVDEPLVTKTLLSTMTYYGTVYNGTQTSLTPIVDVSTQLLTLGGPSAQFNVNSDALAPSSTVSPTPPIEATSAPGVPETSNQQAPVSSSSVDLSDKIARTRSLYTTLTHFITFYSGTKTQLSTIQEISPTVVTEYVDRTLFEQQQADTAASSSVQLVVPTIAPSVALDGAQVLNTQLPATTTTSSTTTTTTASSSSASESTDETSSSSSGAESSEQTSPATATAAAATTTPTPPVSSSESSSPESSSTSSSAELSSISVSQPERPASESQAAGHQEQAKVLASSDKSAGEQTAESKESAGDESNKHTTNIIELSDLIASNSSQSGRVALAGNLGAAIKDIVQLLAGNKTQSAAANSLIDSPTSSTTTQSASSSEQPSSDAPATTTTAALAATTTTTTSSASQANPSTRARPPTRLFGNKQREQQLQGSISSPSATTIFDDSPQQQQSSRPTADLSSASGRQREPQPAATIFFGDEAGDERSKKIKTVWPAGQSTQFVTSIEPSTRSLTLTTTKVYYTRDAPLTITSSFTSVIAPRTFVSTIVGTRTQVNQLTGPTASANLAQAGQAPQTVAANAKSTSAQRQLDRPADVQNKAVVNKYKEQKQQQQQQDQLVRKQQREQLLARQQQEQRVATVRAKEQQLLQQAAANINQCQPACKAANNEICKFTPSSELGAAGSFACACRPGYFMAPNSVGQRACQEVQSYVIMLRLLQVGNEQVAFKREFQQRNSAYFKQFARTVREHVKRAYMTSDLVRDRFLGSEVLSFGRTLSVSSGTSSQSVGAQPAGGKQPIALNASQLDPLNAGVIVNMTIHLQLPTAAQASNEPQVDEAMLKEELSKKLNMRQAAALAAAASAAASVPAASTTTESSATSPTNQTEAAQTSNQTQAGDELLPNPNALFLADVEQVQDLDECASPLLNDCHEGAVCLNEPGSYKCDCRDYPDLNPLNPGRQCANELKSCDFCNNRGDCLRVPSLLPAPAQSGSSNSSSSSSGPQPTAGNGRGQNFSTVCQCHRIYLGRRCEINGLLLATLLPIAAILLIISVCLVIYCCRRWRKRSSMSKGFRNIGAFGPGLIGGTLDRKAMLESSSESSDTQQRARNAALGAGTYESHAHINHHHHHHPHHSHLGVAPTGLSEAGSSSQESSPRGPIMSARQPTADGSVMPSGGPLNPYCGSIPPPIQIPRARHNQVNYAVHRGQVYMW